MTRSLLTVAQAATRMQVSKSIVYALVDSGKLTCHRIGLGRGTIRISEYDLDDYIESCRGINAAETEQRRYSHLKL